MTEISKCDRTSFCRLRVVFCNIALAVFLGGVTIVWGLPDDQWQPDLYNGVLYIALTVVIVTNVLRRGRPQAVDSRWWVLSLCTVSTLTFMAFKLPPGTEPVSRPAYLLMLGCHVLGSLACVYLGRSFSIIPARRQIRTGFIYRVVRHPIYSLYLLGDLIFVTTVPTPRNLVVWTAGAILLYVRAMLEENVLQQDPDYRFYMSRTQWRLIPYVV